MNVYRCETRSMLVVGMQSISDVALANNTGSRQSFEFLQSQYRQRRDNHFACRKPTTKSYTPTKLLDVSRGESTITLVERQDVPGSAPYISWSHCWGTSIPFELTADTAPIACRLAKHLLSKTSQDTMFLARELNNHYSWVDSL